MVMADEHSINVVPGRLAGEQRRFCFRRHKLIGVVVVAEQRIEKDSRIAMPDQYTGVRKVARVQLMSLYASRCNCQRGHQHDDQNG